MDRGTAYDGHRSFANVFYRWWPVLFFAAPFPGCGGLASSGSPQPPPASITVSLSPASVTISLGESQTFLATVNNSTNIAVTWTVNGISGGNSTIGTIDTNGIYTSPTVLPASGPIVVQAVSNADPTKSATADITITSSFSLTISGPASINTGATAGYTATLVPAAGSNPSRTISWSVSGSGCSGEACGTITSTGNYTAPALQPIPANVLITAAPLADSSKSTSVSVVIVYGISVSVSPLMAALPLGGTQAFHAVVTGAQDNTVTWDAGGVVGGNAMIGTVTNSQTDPNDTAYTAPLSVPPGGSVTIRARSNANPNVSASATVTIFSGPAISSMTPANATAGSAVGFTLSVMGGNFVLSGPGPGSIVLVAGVARSTSCISTFECTIFLQPSDVVFAGNISISLRNPDGELSNTATFAVLAPVPDRIPLTPGAPSQVGRDIVVVELSSDNNSGASENVGLNVAAIGAYSVDTSSCSLAANPVVVVRPATGISTADLCVFSTSGLDPSFLYTISGPVPADIRVLTREALGLGIIHLALQVPATAATGPRTLFIENSSKDMAAGTGAIEVH